MLRMQNLFWTQPWKFIRRLPGLSLIHIYPEPVDGEAVIVVWIRWRYDEDTGEGGYTGISWYENDSNNGWIDKYYSLEEWKNYLVTARPTDLNDVLGDWDVGKKTDFLNAHKGELGAVDCIWFGNE